LLRSDKNDWVLLTLDGFPPLKFNESVIDKDPNAIEKYTQNNDFQQELDTLVKSNKLDQVDEMFNSSNQDLWKNNSDLNP